MVSLALVAATVLAAPDVGADDKSDANPDARAPAGSDARPGRVADKEMRYELQLGSGWRALPVADDSRTPLAGFEHRRYDALIAVNRVDYPNLAAWRSRTRDSYFDEIETGARERVDGYRRLGRDSGRLRNIPFYQLTFRYRGDDGTRMVLMRFIFYRRYSLSMTLEVPARSYRRNNKALKRVRDSFRPLY